MSTDSKSADSSPSEKDDISLRDFMLRLESRFDSIDRRFDRIETRLDTQDNRLAAVEQKTTSVQVPVQTNASDEQTSYSHDEDLLPDPNRLPPSFDTIHGVDSDFLLNEENPMRNSRRTLPNPPKPTATAASVSNINADDSKRDDSLSNKTGATNDAFAKGADRRKTMQERTVFEYAKIAQPVTFQAAQPDFEHIKLMVLKVDAIFNFFEEIAEYQTSYGIKIHVPLRVHKNIRRKIMSKYGITSTQLMQLSDDELYNKIRKFVLPDSKVEFSTSLGASVEFNIRSSYKPSPEYFRPFYDALLEFRIVFIKTFELLAADNTDNVPECRNKEGGLIGIFVNKIPFLYGTRVLQELNKKKIEESVYTFLAEFYGVVEAHLECHVKARHLSRFFGGTAYEATKKADKSLSNIKAAPAFDDVYDDDPPPEDEPELDLEPDHEDTPPFVEDSDADGDNAFDDDLAAMQSPAASRAFPGGTGPCFTKVNTGRCDKPNCAFSHSADAIQKARDERIAALRKLQQPAAPKVGVSLPRKN